MLWLGPLTTTQPCTGEAFPPTWHYPTLLHYLRAPTIIFFFPVDKSAKYLKLLLRQQSSRRTTTACRPLLPRELSRNVVHAECHPAAESQGESPTAREETARSWVPLSGPRTSQQLTNHHGSVLEKHKVRIQFTKRLGSAARRLTNYAIRIMPWEQKTTTRRRRQRSGWSSSQRTETKMRY